MGSSDRNSACMHVYLLLHAWLLHAYNPLGTPTYNIRILYVGQSHVPRVLYVGRMHIYPSPTWFWKHGYAHNIRILYVGRRWVCPRWVCPPTSHVYYTYICPRIIYVGKYTYTYNIRILYVGKPMSHVPRPSHVNPTYILRGTKFCAQWEELTDQNTRYKGLQTKYAIYWHRGMNRIMK